MRGGTQRYSGNVVNRPVNDHQVAMMRAWFSQLEQMKGLAWVASRLMDLIWSFGQGHTPLEAIKEFDE